ncbi:MAG: sigma-70 family RNA polymerase sigma factor [Cytophagales bacterium]
MLKSATQESQIIGLLRSGKDKDAIEFLYKNVFPNVKKFVIQRGGNNEDAYDIFQESILELYQMVIEYKFDEKYSVGGFLYKMCNFKWLNKSKRDFKIQFKEEIVDFEIYLNSEQPKSVFSESADETQVLKQYFMALGDKCVELLTNTIILEYSLEEIREKMEFASIGAVKMQHKRCKDKMIEMVKKYPTIEKMLRDKLHE